MKITESAQVALIQSREFLEGSREKGFKMELAGERSEFVGAVLGRCGGWGWVREDFRCTGFDGRDGGLTATSLIATAQNCSYLTGCGHVTVEFILELLAAVQGESDIRSNYPGLTREEILACLSYANYLAREYRAFPICS